MAKTTTPSPINRRQRRERAVLLFREPEFFDDLIEAVGDGATLRDVAVKHDIPYAMLFSFVNSDDARIQKYEAALEARNSNINDRVISGIVGVASGDVRQVLEPDGSLKDMSEMTDEAAAMISAVDVTYSEAGVMTKKVKLHDKVRGLELLGRNQRMFTDKVEHSGILKLEDLVAESMGGNVKA